MTCDTAFENWGSILFKYFMETARPPTTAHPPARTIQLNFETILEKSTFFIIWRAGGCAVVGGRAVSIKYLKSMESQFLNTVSHVIVAHLDRFLAQFEITFEIASFSSHFQQIGSQLDKNVFNLWVREKCLFSKQNLTLSLPIKFSRQYINTLTVCRRSP